MISHLPRFIQSPPLPLHFAMVLKTLTFIPDDNYLNTCPGSPPAFPPSPSVASPIAFSGCTGVISRFYLQPSDWSRDRGAVEETQDENPGGRNGSAGKANPIAEKQVKVTVMLIKVDLQCSRCYEKIRKVLSVFPQLRDCMYDEKRNSVFLTVVCWSPEKIQQKIICRGRMAVQGIEILSDKPKSPIWFGFYRGLWASKAIFQCYLKLKFTKQYSISKNPSTLKAVAFFQRHFPKTERNGPNEPKKKLEKPKEPEKKPKKPKEPEKPKETEKPKKPEKPKEPKSPRLRSLNLRKNLPSRPALQLRLRLRLRLRHLHNPQKPPYRPRSLRSLR